MWPGGILLCPGQHGPGHQSFPLSALPWRGGTSSHRSRLGRCDSQESSQLDIHETPSLNMIYYICLPKTTKGKCVYFTQSNNTRIYKENIITLISRQLMFMVCCGPIMPFFVTTQTSTYIYGGFVLCLFGGFDCFKIFLDHTIPISSLRQVPPSSVFSLYISLMHSQTFILPHEP